MTLAVHPSGYYMCVAFAHKIQFFYILKDSLRHYRENAAYKNCCCLKFSDGG